MQKKTHQNNIYQKAHNGELGDIIAGPCAVESYAQLEETAAFLQNQGIKLLRAGAYKPRTCLNSFQGLGKEGINIIHEISNKYNMVSVSEILDIRDLDYMSQMVDIIQVGTRNMFNYTLLKELGTVKNPIILKRSFMSTIEEFLCATEYIQAGGNKEIFLCERGIRTFDSSTRNTLDLAGVAILRKKTNFPIIVDLSHSLGRKDIIKPMSKASIAAGAHMIMVEIHPNPHQALSDPNQQLNFPEFKKLVSFLNC